jgi:acyl-CoA reductase-like NAD-dependent aldehyde dehydrogenase
MLEHTVRNRLWIGNEWSDAEDGGTFATVNPATGETITEVAHARDPDVDRAVASARQAAKSDSWRNMNPHKRAKLLWKLADAIEAAGDELGALETADNGKPYFESRKVDLPSVVENFRYFAGLADKIQGATIPVAGPFLNYTLREPVGVVGCITPWNFPLSLASWKVAPALACGNAVILKPAEQTPLTAGFPKVC